MTRVRQEATSLVEVLLATLVVGVCLTMLYGSIARGARVAERTEMAYVASQIARELIDEARTLRLDDPAVLAALDGEVSLTGHALDTLSRLGLTRRSPGQMLPGSTYAYPESYRRFHVRRRGTPLSPASTGDAARQFSIVIDISWEEEGPGSRVRAPAGSSYRAVLTAGVQ